MDWLEPTQGFIAKWWAYIDWCLNAEMQAPVCRPFWTWAMVALLVLGVIAAVWIAAKVIWYKLKLAAALRAEEERAMVADEEAMRAHAWDGDKAYQTDLSAEDVERRIKEALVARANERKLPPLV